MTKPELEIKDVAELTLLFKYGDYRFASEKWCKKESVDALIKYYEERDSLLVNKLIEGWKDIEGDFEEIIFMNTGRDIKEVIEELK